MRRVATWLASLACVVALVSGCASWDSPQAGKLSDELSGASTVDPRARDGVVSVDKLDEVEPVLTTRSRRCPSSSPTRTAKM